MSRTDCYKLLEEKRTVYFLASPWV